MEARNGRMCQSCAMAMSRPIDFGTEADGTLCDDYCVNCYRDGTFTWPDATIAQLTAKLSAKAPQWGMTPEEARDLADMILPNLKRRKNR